MSLDARDYFTGLPTELLLKIGGHLDISNKLKLRLVLPKKLEAIVADLLKDVRANLHLDLSKTSLENFDGICQTPFFRDHVTCIVFVPNLYVKNAINVETIEQYRETTHGSELDRRESRRSFAIWQELEEHYSSDLTGYSNYFYVKRKTQAELSKARWILNRGVRNLPQLHTLCIMDRPDREGLNVGTMFLSDKITEQKVAMGHYTVLGDDAGKAAAANCRFDDGGLDILLRAITIEQVQLKAMIFGTAVDQLTFGLDRYAHRLDYHTFISVFSNLTRLTISFSDGVIIGPGECDPDWACIIKTAAALDYLKIILDRENPDEYDDAAQVVYHFFDRGNFSRLKSLHIQGNHEYINTIQAQKLLDFWARHKDSLQEIVLHDIAPSWTLELQDSDATKRILDEARAKASSLQLFKLTLNSRPERDKAIRARFDDLAADLGVSQSSQGWEFGEYVMR